MEKYNLIIKTKKSVKVDVFGNKELALSYANIYIDTAQEDTIVKVEKKGGFF